jgi:hypothetical protein
MEDSLMAAQDSKVYRLAEPTEVDVQGIERELENLWRNASEGGTTEAVLRAAAFNLIYVVRESASAEASELVVKLVTTHPSRAILVRIGDETAPPSQHAWVAAYCQRPSPNAPQVCSEFITLETTGAATGTVVSTLLALLLSGLPTALIWDSTLPADHPLLLSLGGQVERVIVSVIPPCAPASNLHTLFKLRDALGKRALVTDLSGSMLRAWRLAVARLFDSQPTRTREISEILIHHSGTKIPAEMLMLASWMSVSLDWKPDHVALHGTHSTIVFADNRSISFLPIPKNGTDDFLEFRVGPADSSNLLRCDEPVIDSRISEMILLQLQIWGADSVMDAAMHRARVWLNDLLFS